MKSKIILGLLLLAGVVQAQEFATNNYTLTPAALVPDASPVGLTESFNVSGLGGTVTNVQISFDITGGFNGDLYAYLAGPGGGFVVLLNRVGLSGSNPIGYGDAGMSVTLADGASNGDIHAYQNVLNPGGGQLTGTWAPDGRNIDPQSAGTVFDTALSTAMFSSFYGANPNGAWTVFIADLSGNGVSTLQDVTLTIMTVPEPSAWGVFALGLLALVIKFSWNRSSGLRGKK